MHTTKLESQLKCKIISHLVFLQTALLHHFIALLLKGNDDEGHEYVDEEEWEHHKINDIEDGHLHPVPLTGTPVLLSHIHRVLQNSTMPNKCVYRQIYIHVSMLSVPNETEVTLLEFLCELEGLKGAARSTSKNCYYCLQKFFPLLEHSSLLAMC